MKVLDLFSGLRGWSDPWKARGHDVITLDIDPKFDPDLRLDIVEFANTPGSWLDSIRGPDVRWRPDVILASPPCESFSVMTIGRNWTKVDDRDYRLGERSTPKTDKAVKALQWVWSTLHVIEVLQPKFWVIENPRAKLRKLRPNDYILEKGGKRHTVTYCQYGEPFMKPTDLWGGFPPSWEPRPMCRPKAPCHVSAARGSKTGIQGEGRWTHPALAAQSNNGFREGPDGERARTQVGQEAMIEKLTSSGNLTEHKRLQRLVYGVQNPTPEQQEAIDNILEMAGKDGTAREKFQGGMIGVMSRFPSWSKERELLTALRGLIPQELSEEICIAAEDAIWDETHPDGYDH